MPFELTARGFAPDSHEAMAWSWGGTVGAAAALALRSREFASACPNPLVLVAAAVARRRGKPWIFYATWLVVLLSGLLVLYVFDVSD